MQVLKIDQIIRKIELSETFEAEAADHSFSIKIAEYVPYVCTAIHNGHNFRTELLDKIHHSDYDRWYEEDPATADFISSMPILLIGNDSRFEYDLNRSPDKAVYEDAWGKPVWKTPLKEEEKQRSLEKHHNFYRVVNALISRLEKKFKACVVYDMHSYNYVRHQRPTPVFNIGMKLADNKRFQKIIAHFEKELSQIQIPHVETTVANTDIFEGMGYLSAYINSTFKNTLVFPTEVKKVYCNEENGELHPEVIQGLHEGFKKAIVNNAFKFMKEYTNLKTSKKFGMLSKELDKEVIALDKALYKSVSNFELLNYVNPTNVESQKRKFYKSKYTINPVFKYKHLTLDPFEMKRKLLQLPIENINDADVRSLYASVIEAYCDKVDMLSTLGTDKFLYNSLRYFGEPTERDIDNAKFLLYCQPFEEDDIEDVSTTRAKQYFKEVLNDYQMESKVVVSDKIVSKALVLNSKKTVVLKKNAKFSERRLKALAHHEIGVHMVTTMNSRMQPLKVFNLGLPVNTKTQEGLAVLTEYYCGGLTFRRLREISLRVLAIESMIVDNDFATTFLLLHDHYGMERDEAFYTTTRVYRGGGFTKDYLYLRGLVDINQHILSGRSIRNLLIGKTSLSFVNLINEMIERKLAVRPKYLTLPLVEPEEQDEKMAYILNCLK